MADSEADIERVYSFWFEPKPDTAELLGQRMRYWFSGGPDVDTEIRERFGALVEAARAGQLDTWAETPRGALALIVLIDQFSRNVYRGSPDAFSADARAVELARAGYDSGRFAVFEPFEHLFAGMPFSHAEDLGLQKRAVAHAERTAILAGPACKGPFSGSVDFARKHLDVIARFGRFPHRNATLGRVSTPEEAAYLEYSKFAGTWL